MSIKPIDLQTLFVKMDDVSKEQALVKEQAALRQDQAAKAQVAKELAEDRKVTGTPESNEAVAAKDEESEGGGGSKKRERRDGETSSEDSNGREVVKDPDVGRHVDLTG